MARLITILTLYTIVIIILFVVNIKLNKQNKIFKKILASIFILGILIIGALEYVRESNTMELQNKLQAIIKQNPYIKVNSGETDQISFIYNENNEAYAQTPSGSVAVFRKDNKIISFGDEINVSYGVSPLSLAQKLIKTSISGYATMTRPVDKQTEAQNKMQSYLITVKGLPNIKRVYSSINEEYATQTILELFGESQSEECYMSILFVLGDNSEFGMACSIQIGDETYKTWDFDGYLSMFSWELSQEWYSDSNKDEQWTMLAKELTSNIDSKLKVYTKENNIDLAETHDTVEENTDELSIEPTTDKIIIAGIEIDSNLQANTLLRSDWEKLSLEEKTIIVESVLSNLKDAGKKVGSTTEYIISLIDNYYKLNDTDMQVSNIIISVGQALNIINNK